MKLRIAGITEESVVDGPGIRFVVFAQGCPHRCSGCHNPATHDPDGGETVDTDGLFDRISRAKLIRGVTFSGGEPFLQPEPLARLAEKVRAIGLNVMTYTGFRYEQLLEMAAADKAVHSLLAATDILVDGPFRETERDLGLAFRGSRNQRLIDVPRSLSSGKVALWENPAEFKLRA